MLRRSYLFSCAAQAGGSHYWKSAEKMQDDNRGAFNVDAAAEKLGIHPRYAQGLLMKSSLSFKSRGRQYPASQGRSSRPGSKACTKAAMFPLYNTEREVKYALDKSKRDLTNK